ncbi:MAG TPA: FAD-dependent monooxygenase [Vicinamibacterales bacterium]
MVDVLIAGAGPAGAVAAIRLARAGARVLLVDRARFPRDKLCGDTLNPGALGILERLDVAGPIVRAGRPLDGMVVTSANGVAVCGPYGRGLTGVAIRRRTLDAQLVQAAIDAGVQFQDGVRVIAPLVEGTGSTSRVRGAIVQTSGQARLRIPASVTIAADGRRSALAFALALAWQPACPRRWAIGACFSDVPGLGRFGEMHIRDGYYVGVSPIGDGVANVCLVSPAGGGFAAPASLLESRLTTDPLLRDRFAGARRISEVSTLGPLAVEVRAAGVPGLLLAGDAAGFVDPMTGDGLRLAMRGAELAAEAALGWLESPARDQVSWLEAARRREFGVKLRVNRLLRRFVASPRAVRMAAAGARVAPGMLRSVIRYAGDVGAA